MTTPPTFEGRSLQEANQHSQRIAPSCSIIQQSVSQSIAEESVRCMAVKENRHPNIMCRVEEFRSIERVVQIHR